LPDKAIIGLDYSHNNILKLESSSFTSFTQFLFTSGFKVGKIQNGFESVKDLKKYCVTILSSPKNSKLTPIEIDVLEKYVKTGGSLLMASSSGGDITNDTNLNELARKFGFEFVSDEINDSVNYVSIQKRPIISKLIPHGITEQIKKIVFSSSCSTHILDFVEFNKDIKIEGLLISGLNAWHKLYDGENWIEEDCPKIPLLVAVEYYEGKVVAFGNGSIFSSLAKEYGFTALDNNILISNIINWLSGAITSEGKPVSIDLNLELFYWAEYIIKKDKWDKFSDLINVSLKYFKDNYSNIIEGIRKERKEKLKKSKAYKKKIEEKLKEDTVLDKIPIIERKKEDLEEIMNALGEITGEKYEISIDIGETDKEDLTIDSEISKGYQREELEEFEKFYSKKAIWRGKPTKAFKEWLGKKQEDS